MMSRVHLEKYLGGFCDSLLSIYVVYQSTTAAAAATQKVAIRAFAFHNRKLGHLSW